MAPAERIRDLNDELRTTGIGGTTYLTRGMWAMGSDFVAHAVSAVRAFDAFTDDNDPWQEHDCATLDVDGETVIFKIDYYDLNMEMARPTRRTPTSRGASSPSCSRKNTSKFDRHPGPSLPRGPVGRDPTIPLHPPGMANAEAGSSIRAYIPRLW